MANEIDTAHDRLITLLNENVTAPNVATWSATNWPCFGVYKGIGRPTAGLPAIIAWRSGTIRGGWRSMPRVYVWSIPFKIAYVHSAYDTLGAEEKVNERIFDIAEHIIVNRSINDNYQRWGSEVLSVGEPESFDMQPGVAMGAVIDMIIHADTRLGSVS